ncbi:MAG: hypothetical protein OXG23_06685 [Chloroflexi bacterium]|nr:hypothetical protein [Chloroflexota bacterium]
MNPELAHEDFDFLTPPRIEVFQQSLIIGNAEHDSILDGRQHVHEPLNNYHKGTGRRPWFLGHILDAMSDDDGVSEFDTWNMQGLVFDRKYACRFNKVPKRLDLSQVGKPRVIRESAQYRKAKDLPAQQNLFFADETNGEVPPSLSDMVLIDVGYYARNNNPEELYFLLQDSSIVLAMRIISLYDTISASITGQRGVPQPQLELRIIGEEEDTS